jgi:hypothetical protein
MTAVEQAKELMQLVATPSALVTGTFVSFAGKAIADNKAKVDRTRMRFALSAAIAALAVATSLVILLAPLAARSIVSYRGRVEATLIVYWMIALSAAGTAVYCALVVWRCLEQLRRPTR